MTAEIVNLRRARKAKARAEKDAQAEQNRLSFGRTRAEREQSEALKALETRRLDAHKRQNPSEPESEA